MGTSTTIMTWDLLNEPSLDWPVYNNAPILDKWRAFAHNALDVEVSGKLPAYAPAEQEQALWCAYLAFQETLAKEWVTGQASALRAAGARQMISVGLIRWSTPVFIAPDAVYSGFNLHIIAKHLDYLSVHFYPMLRQEEFGWKGGKPVPGEAVAWPEEQQARWGEAVLCATQHACAGWLNWAYADAAAPNADLSAASGLWTEKEKIKAWGTAFAAQAARLRENPPAYAPAETSWEVSLCDLLYSDGGNPPLDWLAGKLAADPSEDIEVSFTNGST